MCTDVLYCSLKNFTVGDENSQISGLISDVRLLDQPDIQPESGKIYIRPSLLLAKALFSDPLFAMAYFVCPPGYFISRQYQKGLFIKVSYSSLYLASLLAFFFTCFTLCYFFLCFFCAVLRSRSCFDRLRLQGKKSLNVTVVQQQCLRSMFVSEYRFGSGSDSSLWFVLI